MCIRDRDRYYQIAKCFRDEDLRADRQPEFTQVDMELSFVDVDDIIDINERLIKKVFKEILDVDVPIPMQRMKYKDAMERYGSDKPDVRFGMEIHNITAVSYTHLDKAAAIYSQFYGEKSEQYVDTLYESCLSLFKAKKYAETAERIEKLQPVEYRKNEFNSLLSDSYKASKAVGKLIKLKFGGKK